MSQYVVMSIGCLCCNEDTRLISVVSGIDAVHALQARTYDEVSEQNWSYAVGLVAYELPDLPPSQSPPIESGHP